MFKLGRFHMATAFFFTFSLFVNGVNTVCGEDIAQEVVSASSQFGRYVFLGEFTGKFPDRSINFEIRSGLRLVSSGSMNVGDFNNVRAGISSDGKRIVLCDMHQGLSIYESGGTQLSKYDGDHLLSRRERGTRPGGTGCHPEGYWCHETNPVTFGGGNFIGVTLHSGRMVEFDLPSGMLSRVGEEFIATDDRRYSVELAALVSFIVIAFGLVLWLMVRFGIAPKRRLNAGRGAGL